MFNENLNWRLDFLGRFILSQKKKVRMNHKVKMITLQYKDARENIRKTLILKANAQKEAETAAANKGKVTLSLEKMIKEWGSYQEHLRITMTKIKTELIKMSKYTIAIQTDEKGLNGYIASLKQDDLTLKCKEVFETYK